MDESQAQQYSAAVSPRGNYNPARFGEELCWCRPQQDLAQVLGLGWECRVGTLQLELRWVCF